MKRILLFTLLLVVALLVAACGGEKATDTPVPTEPVPTVEEVATPEAIVNELVFLPSYLNDESRYLASISPVFLGCKNNSTYCFVLPSIVLLTTVYISSQN